MLGILGRFLAVSWLKLGYIALRISLCAAVILFCLTMKSQAAIVATGNITPSDPVTWSTSTIGIIGQTADGTVNVDGGSNLKSNFAYLGYNVGTRGQATITGKNSRWTNNADLNIGRLGDGTLNVQSGGIVSDVTGILGVNIGSSGTVTVTGAGSKWSNTSSLDVGLYGQGTLNILAGGRVDNNGLTNYTGATIGYGSSSSGIVTVNGVGSVWVPSDYHSSLAVGGAGKGTLNIEAGGAVSITSGTNVGESTGSSGTVTVTGVNSVWFSNYLCLGYSGNGSLNVKEFGQVYSNSSSIGFYPGSTGVAVINGTGSNWSNTYELYVGNYGNGTLNIQSGGQASTKFGIIGAFAGSTGAVNVSGSNSKFMVFEELMVGPVGNGELNCESGGVISCINSSIGAFSGGNIAKVKIVGTGSKWDISGDLMSYGTLTVADGGRVTIAKSFKNSGILNIGDNSAPGGQLSVTNIVLGSASTYTGSCFINNSGILQAGTITKGTGAATFNWNDGTVQNYKTNLTVSSSLILSLASTGTHSFNIDLNRTGTVDALLADETSGGTLNKMGQGTLILTAANTYSGATTVEAGRFKVTGSILNTSGITVGQTGILELAKTSGSATAATLDIDNAGTVLISAGSQTVGAINGTGITQVTGSATLTAQSIVQNSLTIGGTGASSMNAVPEPTTLALLLTATLGGLLWWRRRKA